MELLCPVQIQIQSQRCSADVLYLHATAYVAVPLPCRGHESQEGAYHGGHGAEGLMELLCPVKIPDINSIRICT